MCLCVYINIHMNRCTHMRGGGRAARSDADEALKSLRPPEATTATEGGPTHPPPSPPVGWTVQDVRWRVQGVGCGV